MARQLRHENHQMVRVMAMIIMAMILGLGEATPPGIANNPSHARCLDDKYKTCYNLVHVCPKFCPNGCTVNCQSCKPVCIDGSTPPPDEGGSPTPTPPVPIPSPSPPPPVYNPPPSSPPPPVPSLPPPSPPPPVPIPSPSPPPPISTPPPSPPPPVPIPSPSPPPPVFSPPPPVSTPPPSPPPPVSVPAPSPPPPVFSPPPPVSSTPSPSPPPPVLSPPPPSPPPPVSTPTPSPPPPPVSTPSSSPSPPPESTPSTSPPPPPTVVPTPPSPPSPPPPVSTPSSSPSPPPQPSPTPSSSPLSTPPPPASTPSSSPPPPYVPTPSPTPPPAPSTPSPSSSPASSPTPSTPPSDHTPPSSPTPASPPSNNAPQPPDTWTPPSPPYSPPPQGEEAAGARRRRCRNRNYPQCYRRIFECPSSCPQTCDVDCVTCKPVCNCDMPGAVCQDPRFIGADGITFYFHGKKDKDFCLVTDRNLHINAHFIGKRNENMKRDFTWVQSIAILFGNHRFFVGARKTATWNDAVDRLSLSFDGEPIFLDAEDGATWKSDVLPSTTVMRAGTANGVTVEVDGLFKISAKVVPITQQESKIHNYGITDDDCFAHLELAFKFYSLSGNVNGVLGQTYGNGYVSRVKMGVPMPVIGGAPKYAVSNLFATDCKVSQFEGGEVLPSSFATTGLELPSMKCGSGLGGRGVVCKR